MWWNTPLDEDGTTAAENRTTWQQQKGDGDEEGGGGGGGGAGPSRGSKRPFQDDFAADDDMPDEVRARLENLKRGGGASASARALD